eukprot:CAMPEP_0179405718 /NCGR_PEP_ID=MMETSP0799-20121207/450_1 /TAXON_ID=46947 /ORGANISM="Geminigera cryophila, Strain CCMP2564" /LENGTH=275 /DNA_ID=CAMNT_0021176613 /DNA_START=24 /DNA_END=851 /DNA_ORIENTATION=+
MGLLSGMAYGLVNPLVGHPFNLVQTRMQADAAYKGTGAIATAKSIMKAEGFRGFWRGLVPPLMGSTAYRGVLFAGYSAAFAACQDTALAKPVPGSGGLAPAVLVGAVTAASCRTAVETPLELIKVRRMLGQPWMTGNTVASLFSLKQVRELYKGSSATLARSTGMLVTFFTLLDYTTRFFPVAIATPIVGPFIKGGLCTTIGWAVAWPAEVVKSRVQGDTTGTLAKKSTLQLIRDISRQEGFRGLYRGFAPGACRSFVANGASMVVYQFFQDFRT